MRVELVTPCEHGYEVAHYRCADPPYVCSPDKTCECTGASRSAVSAFSPEAVQAATEAVIQVGNQIGWTVRQAAEAALAAAWAHDFGGEG